MQVGSSNGPNGQRVSFNDLHPDAVNEIFTHLNRPELKQFDTINKACQSTAVGRWRHFFRINCPEKFEQMQAFLDRDSEEWVHWGKIHQQELLFSANKPAYNLEVNSTLTAVTGLFMRTLETADEAIDDSIFSVFVTGTVALSWAGYSFIKAIFPYQNNLPAPQMWSWGQWGAPATGRYP